MITEATTPTRAQRFKARVVASVVATTGLNAVTDPGFIESIGGPSDPRNQEGR